MTTQRDLQAEAARLARVLDRSGRKLVFAESCTGGLASAALAGVAGISAHLCGSAVVYRLATKCAWLGIPESLLNDLGPVCGPVAAEMARGVLERTPEADFAVSITGYLGPDAPPRQDGLLFLATAARNGLERLPGSACVSRCKLPPEAAGPKLVIRRARQREAARLVLATARTVLEAEA